MPIFFACSWNEFGDADAVGAGVVQHVDRLHLAACLGVVVGHVRALEGVGRDGAEVDRLALRAVLRGELRIGDVGIGRGRRDRREIGRRSGSASSPCPRRSSPDRSRRRRSGRTTNFLALVAACAGSYWPAVAVPLSRTMTVELVAGDAALGVRFVDRHQRAVLDARRGFGIRAGQRQLDADGDGLVGRLCGESPAAAASATKAPAPSAVVTRLRRRIFVILLPPRTGMTRYINHAG